MRAKRRPILLTVDDNPLAHEVYGLAFDHGYVHLRAHNGREALRIVGTETVDAMILDLIMPDLHGLEVLELALKARPGLIVVIASVINASQSALRAIRKGATDYFVKPTEPAVMEMVVRQLLVAKGDPALVVPEPSLTAPRILVVGLDRGLRAVLAATLQPRCRVDLAPTVSVGLERLATMTPDLIVLDLRASSTDRVLGMQSLRAGFPEGPMIVVGPADRIGAVLDSAVGGPGILMPEPLDVGFLLDNIVARLPPGPQDAVVKPLSAPTRAAIDCVLKRYMDPVLRVSYLSAVTGLLPDHFAHVFSEEMCVPPMQYVGRVRVQAAILTLRETRDKVRTVARRFGFYDGPHLALTLRRRGLGRPSAFRER